MTRKYYLRVEGSQKDGNSQRCEFKKLEDKKSHWCVGALKLRHFGHSVSYAFVSRVIWGKLVIIRTYWSFIRKESLKEIVLLITSGGKFFLHFLRIITAVILLCKHGDLDKNKIDLCVIGIINSLVTMTAVWQLTSFLLCIPMKSVTNILEVKWYVVFLINIIVLCGSGWFVMILDEKLTMPPIEILYFGPRIGHVLVPF